MEKRGREEQPEWADEIAWRLARLYEQRFSKEEAVVVRNRPWRSTGERLREQVNPETGNSTRTGFTPKPARDVP